MKIKTKYSIGQEVWFMGYKEIYHDKIFYIRVDIDYDGRILIKYELWCDTVKNESQLFPTKEELLKSL